MEKISFKKGAVQIGKNSVTFENKVLQGKYSVWIPREFVEDRSLISNYTYLYSQDNSPLSIAIRYTPVASPEDRKKMIAHHFSRGSGENPEPKPVTDNLLYRDTVARGRDMSVYSLRFSVELPDGILFGCFNCSGADMEDWKPVVLAMLETIEPVS